MSPLISSALLLVLAAGGIQGAPVSHCKLISAGIVSTDVPACIRKQSYSLAGEIGSARAIAEEVVSACRAQLLADAHGAADATSARAADRTAILRSRRAEARRSAFYKVVQARAGRCTV